MILENLKFIAGVLFYSLADLFLAILWVLIVPGVIYGVIRELTGHGMRIKKNDGLQPDTG